MSFVKWHAVDISFEFIIRRRSPCMRVNSNLIWFLFLVSENKKISAFSNMYKVCDDFFLSVSHFLFFWVSSKVFHFQIQKKVYFSSFATHTHKWYIYNIRKKNRKNFVEMKITTSNKNQHKHEYGCHKYDKHANLTTTIQFETYMHSHTHVVFSEGGNILSPSLIHICANS